jgi:integrase
MFSHARNTRPYLDATPIHLIPKAANQMKLDMLEEGLKPTTINRRLAVVKRILHLAFAEWEWIDRPLAQKVIKLSEKGQAREIYLSKKEVTELVSNLGDEARSITLIAAFTGLRRGEILGLKKKHWKKPYIILDSKTKSGKPRAVPVIEEIHDCITPPFSITEYGLRKAFESARETINRPDIRFHDLRHTFASWLVQEPEIPLTTIRDLLGHSSLAVTSKYAHLRGDHLNLVKKALS